MKSQRNRIELVTGPGEKQKAKSGEAASEDVKVNPALKHTAKGVKYATYATVKVSGFVASRVGKLSKGAADYLAKKVYDPKPGAVAADGSSMKKSATRSGH